MLEIRRDVVSDRDDAVESRWAVASASERNADGTGAQIER